MAITDRFTDDDWANLRAELFKFNQTPPVWLGGMLDYTLLNLNNIPISQISGYSQNVAQQQRIIEGVKSTTSTSYTNLTSATIGPALTGLSDGVYQVRFGALSSNSGTNKTYAGPSADGAAVSANDESFSVPVSGAVVPIMYETQMRLSGNISHTLTLLYKVAAGTGTYENRYLVAERISNL